MRLSVALAVKADPENATAFGGRVVVESRAIALAQFAGKYVLVWWYPKADTPG